MKHEVGEMKSFSERASGGKLRLEAFKGQESRANAIETRAFNSDEGMEMRGMGGEYGNDGSYFDREKKHYRYNWKRRGKFLREGSGLMLGALGFAAVAGVVLYVGIPALLAASAFPILEALMVLGFVGALGWAAFQFGDMAFSELKKAILGHN